MPGAFPLEDFARRSPVVDDHSRSDEALEKARSAGYEEGYASGWDDALASATEQDRRISEEFARNLQDLSFTYHEARAHAVASMSGLLEELLDKVFPSVAGEAIVLQVRSVLQKNIEALADTPVRLVVSPADEAAVRALLPSEAGLPVSVLAEAALASGQAYFKFENNEMRVDLEEITDSIRDGMDAVRQSNLKVLGHG